MLKKPVLTSLFALSLLAVPHLVAAQSPPLGTLRQNYQQKMSTYHSEIAQFERDKLLYQRSPTQTPLESIIDSARRTFDARRDVMPAYTDYLTGLIQTYIPDPATVSNLTTQLTQEATDFRALISDFTDIPSWHQDDTNFANVIATLNETAYQSFAQIYWHELSSIIENYTTLYQNQNQRILSEASSQIDRERKARILAETDRSLQSLQTRIAAEKPALSQINSQTSYTSYLARLSQIHAEVDASLRQYAGLE